MGREWERKSALPILHTEMGMTLEIFQEFSSFNRCTIILHQVTDLACGLIPKLSSNKVI